MKKIVSILFVVLFSALTFTKVNAQSNDQALIGKARAAAHDCLQPYESNFEITAGVQVGASCENGGNEKTVIFAAGPRCTGNGPCPLFLIFVASVSFDCNGDVVAVNCNQ